MPFFVVRRAPAALRTLAVLAAVLVLTAGGSAAHASRKADTAQRLAPQVVHTGTGPTGYRVTFRFKAPDATSVRIKGEWYFADPYELSALTGDKDTTITTPGILPAQWKPGDIPIGSPNSSAANWPVAAMTENPRTGVWSYTVPLPSGVFNYGFYVDCSSPTQTGCTEVSDPGNPPWNTRNGKTTGSVQALSQVYVPSDPEFGTVDQAWQAQAVGRRGGLADVAYPTSSPIIPAGTNRLAVYTPPGYDTHRAKPYPTVYLFSGGDNETDWSTQGDVAAILDNLIDTGQIQPMVVVMPNSLGETDDSTGYPAFDANLTDNVIPYVESHYHVSTAASQRAVGGQGFGGSIAMSLLFRHTDRFGYYGVLSPGVIAPFTVPDASDISDAQVAAIKKTGVFVGGGWQEPSVTPGGVHGAGHSYHARVVSTLAEKGVGLTADFVNGGHEWFVWRQLIRDFLTRTAFFPPVTG
ncbi:alpha/beta hydrolase-fold protein [Streptomyces cylindrosporus]|uniref:Alpha/beta hydrolase-fold protein n=1 Tax=Streptomyces cylindrosporus TaxID=2927583 RepID=A0ABS9YDK8_9ACTN|nr:alpha/beta hydrolase-fold protein [Streptomyces cylindrosporus]MCI3275312.1 alpha/beta hydrolase-fold protein [Streptomyces cylindrosporus]